MERGNLTIGRAHENKIVLTENRVSRSHAFITLDASLAQYVLVDQGSRNGTHLNGQRILPNTAYPLHERDKIRIASAVFTVRIVDDPSLIRNEFKELRNMSDTQATVAVNRAQLFAAQSEPALSGNLEQLCPLELFQMLEVSEKTGTLMLHVENGDAGFSISRGRVVAAKFGDIRAEQAVYLALRCAKGTFAFQPGEVDAGNPEINVPTTALLMEGCRILDESLSAQASQ
jgi:pSer/pThr/pTyr-binding forkhead associated (FHA) protein